MAVVGYIDGYVDGNNNEYSLVDTTARTNKADKVSNATNGNFAGLDANGNLTDSGVAASALMRGINILYATGSIPQGQYRYFKIFEYTGEVGRITEPIHIMGSLGYGSSNLSKSVFDITIDFKNGTDARILGFRSSREHEKYANIITTISDNTYRIYAVMYKSWSYISAFIAPSRYYGSFYTDSQGESSASGTRTNSLEAIPALPTIYYEQTVTLSTSAETTVTFTSDFIHQNSIIDYAGKWGLVPTDITTTDNSCIVTLPISPSAETVKVGIFVR